MRVLGLMLTVVLLIGFGFGLAAASSTARRATAEDFAARLAPSLPTASPRLSFALIAAPDSPTANTAAPALPTLAPPAPHPAAWPQPFCSRGPRGTNASAAPTPAPPASAIVQHGLSYTVTIELEAAVSAD